MPEAEPGSAPGTSTGRQWSLEDCSGAEVAQCMLGQEEALLCPPGEDETTQAVAASVVCTMQRVNTTRYYKTG